MDNKPIDPLEHPKIRACEQLAREILAKKRASMKLKKGMPPEFLIEVEGLLKRLPLPPGLEEGWNSFRARDAFRNAVRKTIQAMPVDRVVEIGEAWFMLTDAAKADKAGYSLTQLKKMNTAEMVEKGFGERKEAIFVNVQCPHGGVILYQCFERTAKKYMLPVGEPEPLPYFQGTVEPAYFWEKPDWGKMQDKLAELLTKK